MYAIHWSTIEPLNAVTESNILAIYHMNVCIFYIKRSIYAGLIKIN